MSETTLPMTITQKRDDGSEVEAHVILDLETGEVTQVGGEGEITAADIDLIQEMARMVASGDYIEDEDTDHRESLMITTMEQLDALPEGSVILSDPIPGIKAKVLERGECDCWLETGTEMSDVHGPHLLPARLLWHPDWKDL